MEKVAMGGDFFSLSSIRNYEQNPFNEILLYLRKVLIQATKVFEPQKNLRARELSSWTLQPWKTFIPF